MAKITLKESEFKELIQNTVRKVLNEQEINEGKWIGDFQNREDFNSLENKIQNYLNSGINEISFSFMDKDFTVSPTNNGRLLITSGGNDFRYEALNLHGALIAAYKFINTPVSEAIKQDNPKKIVKCSVNELKEVIKQVIKEELENEEINEIACGIEDESLEEAKPSAGLTSKQKSNVVKKARAGGDIGKKGKGFEKVAQAAKKSGAEDPEAVAGAAMWKNIKR